MAAEDSDYADIHRPLKSGKALMEKMEGLERDRSRKRAFSIAASVSSLRQAEMRLDSESGRGA